MGPVVEPDRLENLVTQVLEETRAFRQEMHEKVDGLRQEMHEKIDDLRQEIHEEVNDLRQGMDEKFVAVRRDVALVQTAVLETAQGLKRVEAKLDQTIAIHGARLDKLEGAAQ